jgi:hypothetical protein
MRSFGAALLLLTLPAAANATNPPDPCAAESTTPDVQFTIALKDHAAVFEEGEIIPLALSFTATKKDYYWADVRDYDRSGRLGIEAYCLTPDAVDPIASHLGGFGGGLGSTRALGSEALEASADLNEYRRLSPGRYQVHAVTYRVWRPPDPGESTPYSRVAIVARSNTIAIEVTPADPEWQSRKLAAALETLHQSPGDRPAARILRFLDTRDSTRELAKLFWGLNQQQPIGWELMFGLYGSPYRQVAIDALRAEIAVPTHPITAEFLNALVGLQLSGNPPADPPTDPDAVKAFWERRREREQELMKGILEVVVEALPRKVGSARALTLNGVLAAPEADQALAARLRPALVAAWLDLPSETQSELIQSRWPLIAGPEMLPILRRILAEPPAAPQTPSGMLRDATLERLYELDPVEGRRAILRDLLDPHAHPSVKLVDRLTDEECAQVVRAAVERVAQGGGRELDFELIDRYAGGDALGAVQAAFNAHVSRWGCAPQAAMLRYLLRVAPDSGEAAVHAALAERKHTGCYRSLLQDIGQPLPKVQSIAIEALGDADPEVVQDAVLSLGKWGTADAEKVLWDRLKRFHEDWTDRKDQLRLTPDFQSPIGRAVALEHGLVTAIGSGTNWICETDKLTKLAELTWTQSERRQIDDWILQWKNGPALLNPYWYPDPGHPTFSVLQYSNLTEEQLRAKVAQLPRGIDLRWQFFKPGQIAPPVGMEKQQEVFDRIRAVAAEHGVRLEPVN